MAGRPAIILLSEGHMSSNEGAVLMIAAFLNAKALLRDRGWDADWLRHSLAERGIVACIPSMTIRKELFPCDIAL